MCADTCEHERPRLEGVGPAPAGLGAHQPLPTPHLAPPGHTCPAATSVSLRDTALQGLLTPCGAVPLGPDAFSGHVRRQKDADKEFLGSELLPLEHGPSGQTLGNRQKRWEPYSCELVLQCGSDAETV